MSTNRPSIPRLKPLARPFNGHAIKPEAKWTDPFYLTPAYRDWAKYVVKRAGQRCEAVDSSSGLRCLKSWPEHRLFADHVVERIDGGAPLDPRNGMCVCASHHAIKTMRERAKRLGSVSTRK